MGDVPPACDLPTGLGKTSVIPIWLIAMASQLNCEAGKRLPRRLVYIVNRRTVVDQATTIIQQMHERLRFAEEGPNREMLRELGARLRELAATRDGAEVLGVSTLRGELADNEQWKADPARPAIVVGTIDLIGSKLLFNGYGDGRYGRAHHAGLIGQDSLIIHDEAHLTPAFSDLLQAVAQEQERERKRTDHLKASMRSIRVMELSATSRPQDGASFHLESEDEVDRIVQERLTAEKKLFLHQSSGDSFAEDIANFGEAHESASVKVLIYVHTPEMAQTVASALVRSLGKSSKQRVALLTGTIRGFERDQLVEKNAVYRAFLNVGSVLEKTVYLVSTSAGEVGIDLDADHMVCDLTTLDAMIQRLGRVNRRGGKGRRARVDVVAEDRGDAESSSRKKDPSDLDKAIAVTHSLLKEWREEGKSDVDVSPGNVRRLVEALCPEMLETAFSPKPDAPPLTDILLDGWSLTSIQDMPGRAEVAPYLHGTTKDPPETYVAWRREITWLGKPDVDPSVLAGWFRACRVESKEWLRDGTDRVKKGLAKLLYANREKSANVDFRVVVLDERGEARQARLSEIIEKEYNLRYRTVILPVDAGGLDQNGMLAPEAVKPTSELPLDVAEEAASDGRRQRWLHIWSSTGERYERLITGASTVSLPPDLREEERIPLVRPEDMDGGEGIDLVLCVARGSSPENPETSRGSQTLTLHTNAVVTQVAAMADRLGVGTLKDALVTAARWHDRGKARPVWQRYACNEFGDEFLAKSECFLNPRALGGYRHELGSLLEAMGDAEMQAHPERDLVLHLIAAHHGWSRPHFESGSFDNSRTTHENSEARYAVLQGFGRLQQRFGRWGLAWLESLLRCADIAASRGVETREVPVAGGK